MVSLQSRLEALEARLLEEFDTGTPPGEIATHECEDCEVLRSDLQLLRWQDLAPELIEKHYADLPLLSPIAFAYFAPAFIRYALHDFNKGCRVLEFLVYNLAPENDEVIEWKRERFRFFTRRQMDVVQEFLQLVVEQDEMRMYFGTLDHERRRLEQHWNERWQS